METSKFPVSWIDFANVTRYSDVRAYTEFLGRVLRQCSKLASSATGKPCSPFHSGRTALDDVAKNKSVKFNKAPGRVLPQPSWLYHRCFCMVLHCFSYSLAQVSPSLAYLAFHHSHICSGHRLCQVYSVDSIARPLLSLPSIFT